MTWFSLCMLVLVDVGVSRFLWRRSLSSRVVGVLSNLYGMTMSAIYVGVFGGKGVVVFSFDYGAGFAWNFYAVMAVCVGMIIFHVLHVR